ncbi:MAG TPA: ubiquinol-cytochrome c reductase iron-sulfur subunit [Planctomycetota bacterium]|nr:ubiquinol-cytochrome c reductase iron-sulfur subunit [Planctomycetota bacterium]
MAEATQTGPRKAETEPTRRSFLTKVSTGWTIFTAASAAGLAVTARFFFPNDLFEPPTKFKIGKPADFAPDPEGMVDERFKSSNAIWVVRNLEGFYVLSTVCTHLGCTPNWLSAERKFKCPCHGSGFYSTGINFEGPAPRPLERFKVTLAPDGLIEVDKSLKYQQEMGQWDDPNSFLKLPYVA